MQELSFFPVFYRRLKFTSFILFFLFSALLAFAPGVLAYEYSDEVETCLEQGEHLFQLGQFNSARKAYEKALSLEPNCADAFNGLGLSYKMEGNYEEAINSYLSALKIQPEHYNSIYNLANTYYLTQNYPEAVSLYLQAMKVKGKPDADLYCSLATVYRDKAKTEAVSLRKVDWERSLSYYQKAVQDDPNLARIHAYLGQLYMDMDKSELAEREFKQAIALKKDYAFAYFHLGRLEQARGHLPAALIAWRYSLKYETVPSYREDTIKRINEMGMSAAVMDHFAKGYECLAKNQYDSAEAEFESASHGAGPMKAVALSNFAYACVQQKRLAEALTAYQEALKIAPHGYPEIYFNLAQTYRLLKKPAQAEKAIKQCLAEAKGNHYLSQNVLGILLKERGDKESALKHYNFAQMQSADALPVVHLNKAILLEKQGKSTQAAQAYGIYLKFEPHGLNADFARSRLAHLK